MFTRYLTIGVFNTLLHWLVFYVLYAMLAQQGVSNFIAFVIAASQSYFLNARYTFNRKTSAGKYVLFTGAMGVISFFVGYVADYFQVYALLTPVIFSGISLTLGFLFSKYFVFSDDVQ